MYDYIAIKTAKIDQWLPGRVTNITEHVIELDTSRVFKLDQLTEIRYKRKGREGIGKGLNIAGLGWAGITAINGYTSDVSSEVTKNNFIIAGGLYAFGWLVRLTSNKRFRLEQYYIEYIDLNKYD